MKSLLFSLLVFISGVCCASESAFSTKIIGKWAMSPLKGGIASVMEFSNDGTAKNHEFRCQWETGEIHAGEIHNLTYEIEGKEVTIFNGPDIEAELEIKSITDSEMTLFQKIDFLPTGGLLFNYSKVEEVKPLCFDTQGQRKT